MAGLLRAVVARCLAVVAGCLAAVALVSCTPTQGGPSMTPEEQLRARPSFAQAERDYLGMLSEMRTALSGTDPSLRWREDAPSREGRAGCGAPFDVVADAESANYTSGHAAGAIPDDLWPAALGEVERIASSHGFTRTVTVVDEPGNHVVSIYDEYAAEVTFGTRVNTVLGVIGGCFLTDPPSAGRE